MAPMPKWLSDCSPTRSSRSQPTNYDWLGTGVYFWEHGAKRALRFAHDQKKRGKVKNPTVIGALIQLGNCFDLLDTQFTDDLFTPTRQSSFWA